MVIFKKECVVKNYEQTVINESLLINYLLPIVVLLELSNT